MLCGRNRACRRRGRRLLRVELPQLERCNGARPGSRYRCKLLEPKWQRIFSRLSLSLTRSGPDNRVARIYRPPNLIGPPALPPTPEIITIPKQQKAWNARARLGSSYIIIACLESTRSRSACPPPTPEIKKGPKQQKGWKAGARLGSSSYI